RRRFDRDEIVEPLAGEDEAARMLGEMARRPDQLLRQLERQRQAGIGEIEVELRDVPFGHTVVRPAPYLSRQGAEYVLGKAERLADLAHRPTRTVAADHRGQ